MIPETFIGEAFVEQVLPLALSIAQQVRGENHLQPFEVLVSKFWTECRELAEAENVWDEIPDIIYYAACCEASGKGFARVVAWARLMELHIDPEEAMIACLAKYQRRAAGLPKDILAEREAILAALHTQ